MTSIRRDVRRDDRIQREGVMVIGVTRPVLLHVTSLGNHRLTMIAEAIDDAVELGDAFPARRSAVIGIGFGIGNERRHFTVLRAADPDAARFARIVPVALNVFCL